MTSHPADSTHSLRWTIYWLLIVAAAASASGRIFSVTASGRDPKTPFLSANDRSRWAMIRALVDRGRFEIDDVIFDPETGKRVSGWHTIDLVKHHGRDGREHYYSSKPVLMPTLMAGVYWLVKQATGASFDSEYQAFYVGRIVLWLCNVPPLVVMWWLLARLIDRYGRDDWSRVLTMVAATFGTFLTTFAVTLNNHVHAAVCVTTTVYCLARIWEQVGEDARQKMGTSGPLNVHFFLAGLFAALTFANELPALSFLALAAAAAVWCDRRKALLLFAPGAVVVVVAMVALNYAAHGSFRPPYTHRSDGPLLGRQPILLADSVRDEQLLQAVRTQVGDREISSQAAVSPRLQVNPGQDVSNRYTFWDPESQTRLALNIVGNEVEIREWDNWYEYEGTYWTADNKRGVDQGEESRLIYAVHCLIGHHGLLSLTPLWLIAFAGMAIAVGRRDDRLRWFAAGTLLLSMVVLAFYLLLSPLQDRNYGGVTNGLRWMMWFIPLYLLGMLPALARMSASRWGRTLAIACLAVSVFSACYTPMNPWHHPWIFDLWSYLGWIAY